MKKPGVIALSFFFAMGWGATGCESLNKVSRNMDIASEHVTTQKPVYAGTLQSTKKVGALTALLFQDGKSYEVVDCPAPLLPGDTVRVYQSDKGFIAHLYKAAPTQVPAGVKLSTSAAPGRP